MNNEEEKIKQLEGELVKAFLNRDIKELDRILADEFIITDPNCPSYTKEKYLSELEADRVSFKSLVLDEVNVRVIEGSAVVTGKATADGRSPDDAYQGQYSFKEVVHITDLLPQKILRYFCFDLVQIYCPFLPSKYAADASFQSLSVQVNFNPFSCSNKF